MRLRFSGVMAMVTIFTLLLTWTVYAQEPPTPATVDQTASQEPQVEQLGQADDGSLELAPSNDDFDNAKVVTLPTYNDSQSTTGATRTRADDPTFTCVSGKGYRTVWYRLTTPVSGKLKVNTGGSTYDTVAAVWRGARGSLTSVGCNDDFNEDGTSYLSVNVTGGTTYYVEVASKPQISGTLAFSTTFTSNWQTIKSEKFDGSFPNQWKLHNGTGQYLWGKRDCRPYAGAYSGWYVGWPVGAGTKGTALACNAKVPNNTNSWMVYGPFSLKGATAADMRFQLKLNAPDGADGLGFAASADGVNFYGVFTTGTTSGKWLERVLNLKDVPGLGNLAGKSKVWIALAFQSNGKSMSPGGAYVDNITVRKCPWGTCSGALSIAADPQARIYEQPMVLKLPQ